MLAFRRTDHFTNSFYYLPPKKFDLHNFTTHIAFYEPVATLISFFLLFFCPMGDDRSSGELSFGRPLQNMGYINTINCISAPRCQGRTATEKHRNKRTQIV